MPPERAPTPAPGGNLWRELHRRCAAAGTVILSIVGSAMSASMLMAQTTDSLNGQATSQELLPPANGRYMIAAYVVVGCIYLAYTVSLLVRGKRAGL